MANIKAQDLPEKLTKAVKDDRVLMIDSEDYNRLKTQPAEYYRGDDGVSPTVEVVDTPPGTVPAGHTVTITDKNGPKSFFVKDGGGDMEKAVYDKNDNGIVDDAEHAQNADKADDADNLGGKPASDYVLKEEVQDNINTKTFYIKGESDLTTAQEIYERYKQGKNPIIIYSNVSFTLSNLFNDRVEFMASKDLPYDNSLCTPACIIYYSGNNVTQVKLRMLTAINVKTINNETILGEGNINITGGAYERPVIKINLTPDKTVYKKGATASITELKAVITKGSADLQSVTFKKNDAVISEVTEGIKDGGEVICNCGTALNNLTENTKLTVEVNDGESVTSEIVNIEFVNPFYYGASASNIVNGTAGFTEDVSTKGNKTYAYSPNWEHNTIIYDDSYGELKDIRDDNGFSLISGFSIGTFEDGTVTYRYYAETNATNDDNVEYTYYFTEGGGGGSGGGGASIAIDTALSTTSGNPVQNKVITTAMQGKQDILESGVNIKTINGNSLLGGGNIEIQGGTGDAYTKAETDTLLADKADKSDTYTKAEINEQMGNKVDSTAYNTAIQDLQDQIDTKANVSSTYTKTETDLLLNNKADAIDVYTKLETDDLLDAKANVTDIPDMDDYYTKTETDALIPDISDLATKSEVNAKQDTLVSGTNIKTINGNSLLGNGNIEIQGGTTISVDSELSDTSENPVQNKVIKQALDAKANTTDIPDVSNFATKSELPDMTDYYDKSEVDALIPDVSGFATKTELNDKADKSTTYTKTEVDDLIPDISTLATKTELSAKADATDVNTKTFYVTDETDLTNAQLAFDWFKAGKNPIIVFQNVTFITSNLFDDRLEFTATKDLNYENDLLTPACILYYTGNNVTQVKFNMITSVSLKTINNQTLFGTGNINIQGGEGNTKTFELASFSDLTTGQAILDWYLAGKTPLISHTYSSASVSGKYTLTLSGTTSNTLVFHIPNFYDLAGTGNLVGTNSLNKTKITITFNSNNEVTSITGGHDADGYFLKADENYATPYTPLYDGSPATKKYVDDAVAGSGGGGGSEVEMIAGENINAGDPVCVGYSEIVETVSGNDIALTSSTTAQERTFNQRIVITKTGKCYIVFHSDSDESTSTRRNWTVGLQLRNSNGDVLYNKDILYRGEYSNTTYTTLFYVNGEIENIEPGNYDIYIKYSAKPSSNYYWGYNVTLNGFKFTIVSDEKKGKLYNYNTATGNKVFLGFAKENKNAGENVKISSLMYKANYSPLSEIYKTNTNTIEQGTKDIIGNKYLFSVDGTNVKEHGSIGTKTIITYNMLGCRRGDSNPSNLQILKIPIFTGIRPIKVRINTSTETVIDLSQVNIYTVLKGKFQIDENFIYFDFSQNTSSGTSTAGTFNFTLEF